MHFVNGFIMSSFTIGAIRSFMYGFMRLGFYGFFLFRHYLHLEKKFLDPRDIVATTPKQEVKILFIMGIILG